MDIKKPGNHKKNFSTIDEYINAHPENVKNILQRIRQIVQQAAPEATETISYQVPAFKIKGRYLIYFAAWRDHISVYPLPVGSGEFQKELSAFVTGKGTVSLPLGKPIPYDLVRKIVDWRLIGLD